MYTDVHSCVQHCDIASLPPGHLRMHPASRRCKTITGQATAVQQNVCKHDADLYHLGDDPTCRMLVVDASKLPLLLDMLNAMRFSLHTWCKQPLPRVPHKSRCQPYVRKMLATAESRYLHHQSGFEGPVNTDVLFPFSFCFLLSWPC